ncbi:PR domain zinc finger protein 16-like isoform X4 [Elysia marginata]|uniref:PR domain zinc finger protein 16-like isoform X4 n=1 Tax=Elysia marginata TaxID=1093978 RepID=A0AAV4IFP3_9GAST|nr:PR domain zinc finger protein 16-like isoform X4 [Elysia marginata]
MVVAVVAPVFYKSVRDIGPGEEMLLYAREAVYPELELEALARHNSLTAWRLIHRGSVSSLDSHRATAQTASATSHDNQ